MRIRYRAAATALFLALAGGGAVSAASPAAAASASGTPRTSSFSCDAWRYLRGANGHGASITCHGSPFREYVICHRPDGHLYFRLGNRALSGGTSTAWCDRSGEVIEAGAFPF
ncbi:hypothetical protein [Streptomyces orinoci]|uniref:Secreted protein n=1 Tax=Streptomyces orinoci TaxID=67339 RepID=A0ABV3JZ43_STRON|nr:hypothetical protein [Streptomyces orinoci]